MADNVLKIPIVESETFVLPGEEATMEIAASSEVALLRDCILERITFGIPIKDGEGTDCLGTEVVLREVKERRSDGSYVVVVKGLQLFKHQAQNLIPLDKKRYKMGEILPFAYNETVEDPALIEAYKTKNAPFWKQLGIEPPTANLYEVAMSLDLLCEDKMALVSLESKADREAYLLDKYLKLEKGNTRFKPMPSFAMA